MDVLNTLLEISIYSGVIYIVLMAMKKAFQNRMSPLLQYAVWILLVARLMLPFTMHSGIRLVALPEPQAQTQKAAQLPSGDAMPDAGAGVKNQPQSPPQPKTADVPRPLPAARGVWSDWDIYTVLLDAWLLGTALACLYFICSYVLLRKRISRDMEPVGGHLLALFRTCKKELGIRGGVKIAGVRSLSAPALLAPATVLFPANSLTGMDDAKLKYALRHELVHYQRRDHAVCALLTVLQAIYWFNPFVWLAFRQIRSDMEVACDSGVVKRMGGDEKADYAGMILALFARPKSARMVLGMAQGSTKRTAERRIRGIFMNRKSGTDARLISFATAAVLLVGCFTTACQPSPGRPIVRQKDSNTSPGRVSTVPYGRSDFPDSYRGSYSKNGADIFFDAAVELPDADRLQAYDTSPAPFSQAQVDTIWKGLFGERQLYAPAQATKSDIEPLYLQALSRLNEKKKNPGSAENSLDDLQSRVNQYKDLLEAAPETDTLTPVDGRLKRGQESTYFGCRGDLGKATMATLSIVNSVDYIFMRFTNGNQYADMSTYYPDRQDTGPSNLKRSKEEAIAEADDLIGRLGAVDMRFSGCATGIFYTDTTTYPETFDPQTPQAYLVYYTRSVNGAPLTFDSRGYSSGDAEDSYAAPILYERIMVAVDDGGVSYVNWQGPIHIDGAVDIQNRVIPFSDMIDLAKNQLSYQYATYDDQPKPTTEAVARPLDAPDNGKAVGNEVHIRKITLGLMQLPVKNGQRYELVPVWDFFGYSETVFESGTRVAHGPNEKSLLTINAINGAVIDRTRGY